MDPADTQKLKPLDTGRSAVLLAVANIERLSGSPLLLSKALRILRDPNSDSAALVDLIAADPALTAGTIQLANSALYGARRKVATLPEAVHLLGYAEIYRSVGLHLSRSVLAAPLTCYGLAAEDFWRSSILGALCLQALAEHASQDPSEAYTVGLLHALGRLAIDQGLRETGLADRFRADPLPFEERELKYTRLTYAEVGGLLLEGWRFPGHLIEAVRCQLDALRPSDPPLTCWLQVTRTTLQLGLGSSLTNEHFLGLQPALDALHLTAATWRDMVRQAEERADTIRRTLSPR